MRKTKIIGFSVPPELNSKFNQAIKNNHKTKSEFFREMMDSYFNLTENMARSSLDSDCNETDLARILKSYWNIRSNKKIKTIIIGLGIISHQGKVLIGGRKNKDPWVENLSWVFPGGKMESLDFEQELHQAIIEETNIDIKISNLIAARIHPDSGFKEIQIVALYFSCQALKVSQMKPGGELKNLKWVKPTDVFRYFTTSTCDEVTKYLVMLEKAEKG